MKETWKLSGLVIYYNLKNRAFNLFTAVYK